MAFIGGVWRAKRTEARGLELRHPARAGEGKLFREAGIALSDGGVAQALVAHRALRYGMYHMGGWPSTSRRERSIATKR